MAAPPPYSSSTEESHSTEFGGDVKSALQPQHSNTSETSLDDDFKDLPPGWLRQFDPITQHTYYVNTKADPIPQSYWTHPYYKDNYLSLFPEHQRAHIASKNVNANSSSHNPTSTNGAGTASSSKQSVASKIKDKLTGSTQAERDEQARRAKARKTAAHEEGLRRRQDLLQKQQLAKTQGSNGSTSNNGEPYYPPPNAPYGRQPKGMTSAWANYGASGAMGAALVSGSAAF